MKKIFKKNQIIITALALMIAAAGYLSYTYSGIGDDKLEQASADLTEEDYDIVSKNTQVDADIFAEEMDTLTDDKNTASAQSDTVKNTNEDSKENSNEKSNGNSNEDSKKQSKEDTKTEDDTIKNPGETVLTSTNVQNVNFAVEAKLNREQVRSQNKEDLMEVINSTAISDKEKQDAVDKMVKLTDVAQRESDAEMLLEAKGFTDVVVSITEDAADVVLNMGDVTDAKRAQIEDIVKRKTKVSAENIVITPITTKAE